MQSKEEHDFCQSCFQQQVKLCNFYQDSDVKAGVQQRVPAPLVPVLHTESFDTELY